MKEYSSENILSTLEPLLDEIKKRISSHPVEYRRPTFVRALQEWAENVLVPINYQAV